MGKATPKSSAPNPIPHPVQEKNWTTLRYTALTKITPTRTIITIPTFTTTPTTPVTINTSTAAAATISPTIPTSGVYAFFLINTSLSLFTKAFCPFSCNLNPDENLVIADDGGWQVVADVVIKSFEFRVATVYVPCIAEERVSFYRWLETIQSG